MASFPSTVEEIAEELKPVLDAVLADYALPVTGDHGVLHWARVLENGIRLAGETGAIVQVVSLFAVLHDARRVNEFDDPRHGWRGGRLAIDLQARGIIVLPPALLDMLVAACDGHTEAQTHPSVTIQVCYDADRLDLGRVGIRPNPAYLCTEAAKRPDVLKWGTDRGRKRAVPDFAEQRWLPKFPGKSSPKL